MPFDFELPTGRRRPTTRPPAYINVVAIEGCGINTKSNERFRPGGFAFDASGYVESPEEPRQAYPAHWIWPPEKRVWEFQQIGSTEYGVGLLSTAGGLIFSGCDLGILTSSMPRPANLSGTLTPASRLLHRLSHTASRAASTWPWRLVPTSWLSACSATKTNPFYRVIENVRAARLRSF